MGSKYRVLIFEGRARQSLPLAKAFKEIGCEVSALCGGKFDVSYVSRFVDHKIIGICDEKNEKETVQQIVRLVKTKRYDLVVPTTDFAATILSKYKKIIEQYVNVASNSWDVFCKAVDKNKTMAICSEIGIPHPKTIQGVTSIEKVLDSELQFPIVVKPCVGYGAIGFKKVSTGEELKRIFVGQEEKLENYVFQEYIPQTDIQYECAMFIDEKENVKTALVFSKNRWFPIEGGSSTLNVTVNRPDIVEQCAKLLKAIHWRGAADIDLIQDSRDGKAKIMEINPRVSGSVKICFEAGVNQALQMMQLATGQQVTKYDKYKLDQRLRCSQTDLLWFIKSPNRFRSKPFWFSLKNTKDQIFYWDDPLPYIAFTIHGLLVFKEEMRKRS